LKVIFIMQQTRPIKALDKKEFFIKPLTFDFDIL